jgi:hypothetical protein
MFGGRGDRRGPGVLRTMARTAVISATATATSNAVNNRMASRAEARQQEAAIQEAGFQAQADVEQLKAQLAAMQAQQAQASLPVAAPAQGGGAGDLLAQIQQLAALKEAGALTDAEFQAAKAKLLGI